MKGAATLYSKEYFEECKRHLKPGGVITQWVPLYESDPDTVKSEIATFFDVFPNGTIWANDNNGQGYDVVLLGQVEPTKIDVDALQARLDRPDYAKVRASLQQVGFPSALSLLDTYLGRASDLKPWLAGAQINRDIDLRLQYLAGMGVNNFSANRHRQPDCGPPPISDRYVHGFAGNDRGAAGLDGEILKSKTGTATGVPARKVPVDQWLFRTGHWWLSPFCRLYGASKIRLVQVTPASAFSQLRVVDPAHPESRALQQLARSRERRRH